MAKAKTLAQKILSKIKQYPNDMQGYNDLLSLCVNEQNRELGMKLLSLVRKQIKKTPTSELYEMFQRVLLFNAPFDFDSYLIYMELNRKPAERFYQPRRKVLKPLVDALQKLADDELDELFLSQPPRTGKTTMVLFFVSWVMGRNTEYPNLYCSYSGTITTAFYNGVMEIITDKDTYRYADVFPKASVVRTNALEGVMDLERRKHYATLTCRSLYGTLNGACDAEKGFIISDDLIGGIEEALNKDRLMSAWAKVDNNLIPRGKGGTRYLWIGTRWSVIDPISLRLELLRNDAHFKNYRFLEINLPALDENDESNFEYEYGVGFDTDYYKRRRASFERNNDMASWLAQYMGQPIEREGTLFSPGDFRFFNGDLPDYPDRIYMAIDPAFGGGDFVAAPICYQYGDDIYIPEVVYSDADKRITIPMLAEAIVRHEVGSVQIEANKSTEGFAKELSDELKNRNYKCLISTKPAPTNKSKETRIFEVAPDIRECMIFVDDGNRDKAYSLFMTNVYSFKIMGKNKHDDAPDSLAMAIDMVRHRIQKIKAVNRPF